MNWSTGCAFSLDDVLMNFPFKSLLFTCNDSYALIKDNHRNLLVKKIFMFNLKQVIIDIILNNVTFWLPLTGNKKCNIHMKSVRGDDFKRLRRAGKWKDIDILNSMFTGYELSFYMLGKRTPRVKTIYLNKNLRNLISNNTNNGMAYGDGKIDSTLQDYLEEVYILFPTISKLDINRILRYCWKSVYLHNSYGGDVLFKDKDIWCYIGNLKKNSLDHYYYYIRKLIVKIRVLYKRKKIEWDGYYYFTLNNTLYQKYIDLKNKRGRPKKRFSFGTVCLYQIQDECRLSEHLNLYIFRVPFISKIKLKYIIRDFISDRAELISVREPLKFKDILVNDNEYEFI